MELKVLNESELERLYKQEMTGDFPADELRPARELRRLQGTGRYQALEAWEEGQPVGYALMWEARDGGWALLDYLAVLRGRRNAGTGGRILDELSHRYSNIVLEAEDPACAADDADLELRRHRLDFYSRNGFSVMDYDNALFGVRFKCLHRGAERDGGTILEKHTALYDAEFIPQRLSQYYQMPLRPGEEVLSLEGIDVDSLFSD